MIDWSSFTFGILAAFAFSGIVSLIVGRAIGVMSADLDAHENFKGDVP